MKGKISKRRENKEYSLTKQKTENNKEKGKKPMQQSFPISNPSTYIDEGVWTMATCAYRY